MLPHLELSKPLDGSTLYDTKTFGSNQVLNTIKISNNNINPPNLLYVAKIKLLIQKYINKWSD